MVAKQSPGSLYAKDGSKYGCITDGDGQLVVTSTSASGTKQNLTGSQAPDGSINMTLTDGAGSLV